MIKHLLTWIITASLTLSASQAPALNYEIDTAKIIEKSLDLDCIDWQPKGVCVFLVCNGPFCSIETNLYVEHYLPDFVVQTYSRPDEMLWSDMRKVLASPSEKAGKSIAKTLGQFLPGGGANTQGIQQHSSRMIFNNASVIGHPGTAAVKKLIPGLVCKNKPAIQPFRPYFDSMLDLVTWRTGIPEWIYPASFTPGLRELGQFDFQTFLNNPSKVFRWGNIFPRTGMSVTTEFPKASALVAVRAMDIVTRKKQPHVYKSYIYSGSKKYDHPLDVRKDKWQQLAPKRSKTCERFGTNDTQGVSWAANKVPQDNKRYNGAFVWNYWHHYQCCTSYPGKLLKVIK